MSIYEVILHSAEKSGDYRSFLRNSSKEKTAHDLMQMAVEYTDRCGAEVLDVCFTKQQAIETYKTQYINWIHTSILEPGTWPGPGYGISIVLSRKSILDRWSDLYLAGKY